MKRSNFALRLQSSLLEELRKTAAMEGVPVNQFINVAVAEKLATWRTEEFFRERAKRANLSEAFEILARAGKGNLSVRGDELPEGWNDPVQPAKKSRRKATRTAVRKRK